MRHNHAVPCRWLIELKYSCRGAETAGAEPAQMAESQKSEHDFFTAVL